MRETGEYGEFFPMEMSPFPYEDSMSQDYFPAKEKVIPPASGTYLEVDSLPDDINGADIEAITKNAYRCPETNKLFRFQKQELEFYKKLQLPIPRASFEARYKRRNRLVPFPY